MVRDVIAVVVPFSRPKFSTNVLENFGRQSFKDKTLIVVENGRGSGTFPEGTGAMLVSSEAHRSHARNMGILTAKSLGIDYWAIMEDDDYYGPDYLQEVWDERGKGDVTGKASWYQRYPSGEVWLLNPTKQFTYWDFLGHNQLGKNGGILAATLAGYTTKAVSFRPEIEYGEEIVWYHEMSFAGHTLWSRGSLNFMMIKHDDPDHHHAGDYDWTQELRETNAIRIR